MLVAIVGTIANVILDIVFVYGIESFIPAMNIQGAAYASVIAQIIMALISGYLLITKTEISLKVEFPFNKEVPRFIGMILNLFARTLAVNWSVYYRWILFCRKYIIW